MSEDNIEAKISIKTLVVVIIGVTIGNFLWPHVKNIPKAFANMQWEIEKKAALGAVSVLSGKAKESMYSNEFIFSYKIATRKKNVEKYGLGQYTIKLIDSSSYSGYTVKCVPELACQKLFPESKEIYSNYYLISQK